MAIGSKSNVKLVYVGQSNAIQDFLLVPCCSGVWPHCVQCFPLYFKALESNVTEAAGWIGEGVYLGEFTCVYILNEQQWCFSKVTQKRGANYLTVFCQKLGKDRSGRILSALRWIIEQRSWEHRCWSQTAWKNLTVPFISQAAIHVSRCFCDSVSSSIQ